MRIFGFKQTDENTVHVVVSFIVAAVIFLVVLVSSAYGLPDNLSGSIHMTGTSTKQNEQTMESVDQRYLINWHRNLSSYLRLRAGFSYDRYGADLGEGGNVWRRQVQPMGELQWSHPFISVLATARRREATTDNRITDLIQNSYLFNASSRSHRYPILSLRYGLDEIYNKYDRSLRDTRQRTLQADLSYSRPTTTAKYIFTRRDLDNYSFDLNTVETSHQIRLLQSARLFNQRLSAGGDYSLRHRRESDRLLDADTTVRAIDLIIGLYAQDATPELGALDTLSQLTDGDVDHGVQPPIDIGRSIADHNIGVDFGFSRSVLGLYIYTDEPSGSTLRWQIYTSSDNIIWNQVTVPVRVTYNTAFRRYEIAFDEIDTRYIKAVNAGINEVLSVRVTEIEALEEVTGDRENQRSQTVHNIDLNARYRFNSNWQVSAEFNFRREPSGNFSSRRDRLFFGFAVTHRPSDKIMQTAKVVAGRDDFRGAGLEDETTTLTYALQVRPAPTMDLLLSGFNRNNSQGGLRFQETNNVLVKGSSTLWRGLRVQAEGAYSRNNQFIADRTFDTWTWRTSADAILTASLDIRISTLYQTTTELDSDSVRIRRTHTGSADFAATSSITVRGTVTIGDDQNREYISQDYSFSWRLSPKLTASSIVNIIDSDRTARSERQNVRLSYQASTRTLLFAGFTTTEVKDGISRRVSAFQLGFRTGF